MGPRPDHANDLRSHLESYNKQQYDKDKILFVTTSFSALNNVDAIHELRIIDFSDDQAGRVDHPSALSEVPLGATTYKSYENGNYHWHLPASILLRRTTDNSYWLASMDERSFFVSRLPRSARKITQAFEYLMPTKVKIAKGLGPIEEPFKRQGEWFLIPFADGKDARDYYYKDMEQNFILPREYNGNPHRATRGGIIDGRILIAGRLVHPEHTTIYMSDTDNIIVYEAIRNTAKENYSETGVD